VLGGCIVSLEQMTMGNRVVMAETLFTWKMYVLAECVNVSYVLAMFKQQKIAHL